MARPVKVHEASSQIMLIMIALLAALMITGCQARPHQSDIETEEKLKLLSDAMLPTELHDEGLETCSVCQYLPASVSKLLKSRGPFVLRNPVPPVAAQLQNKLGMQQFNYKFDIVQLQGSIRTSASSCVIVATIPNPTDPVLGTVVGKEGTIEKVVLDEGDSITIKLFLQITDSGLFGKLTIGSDTIQGTLAIWPAVLDLKPGAAGPMRSLSSKNDMSGDMLNITMRDPVTKRPLPIYFYNAYEGLPLLNRWDTDENVTLIMQSSDQVILAVEPIGIVYKCGDDSERVKEVILPGKPFVLPSGCEFNQSPGEGANRGLGWPKVTVTITVE